MSDIDGAIKACSPFTPPLNPILRAILHQTPLKYWKVAEFIKPFNDVEILLGLERWRTPAIGNIKVESKRYYLPNDLEKTGKWLYEITMHAEVTPKPGKSFEVQTTAVADSRKEGIPIVARKMLALLWEDRDCLRKYYRNVPTFFDNLHLAAAWPPLSNSPESMQQFIEMCKEPGSTVKIWDEKLKRFLNAPGCEDDTDRRSTLKRWNARTVIM
ncbi:hypothetical protein BDZ45DRAFT_697242 [Acephala macrosclerotiorum]|nr:hypothetical protein BDZ45DRAFT_697242 [Acephala macrosclerotiorum]